MADKDSASVQFKQVDDQYSAHQREAANATREHDEDVPAPLSAGNMSSADAAVAWRIRRGRHDKVLPYSKKTRSSMYDFKEDK